MKTTEWKPERRSCQTELIARWANQEMSGIDNTGIVLLAQGCKIWLMHYSGGECPVCKAVEWGPERHFQTELDYPMDDQGVSGIDNTGIVLLAWDCKI